MFIYYLFLSFFISIDSFGIGITYGLKNTKFSLLPNVIVFMVSAIITYFSILIGNTFSMLLPDYFASFIGCAILVFMGFWIIFHPTSSSDFDGSNSIDLKEAFSLGIALSIDSIGIGIGISSMGNNSFVFPILVAFFNSFFLAIR